MRKQLSLLLPLDLLLSAAVVAAPVDFCMDQDVLGRGVGIWRMNKEQSHWPGANTPRTVEIKIERQGRNSVREHCYVVTDFDAVILGDKILRLDKRERSVPGHPGTIERCEALDANTVRCTEKRNGNVILELLGRLSKDRKSEYVVRTQLSSDGKPAIGLAVYQKE